MITHEKKYDVAAYVWPAYTGDEPRTRIFWPKGIGEWETVQAGPRANEDAYRLRKPVWGYVNEADPFVMEMEIEAAAAHGVNVFIYDWYWFDNRPFLENCLNDGYLKARNNDKVKFYVMWANHNAGYTWDSRIAGVCEDVDIWKGTTDSKQFRTVATRLINQYFHHPSYYTIDGKPVLAIYDIGNLIAGLGGIKETQEALNWMREECEKSGLPGLHIQLIRRYPEIPNLSGVDGKPVPVDDILHDIRIDSTTHYQYAHMSCIDRDYAEILAEIPAVYEESEADGVPYFPHVSVGWDNNLRFSVANDNITTNNPPEMFEKALMLAKEYLDAHPDIVPLVTVNSWNEWTECSYLQPDYLYGYGYLEAVKKVFGD